MRKLAEKTDELRKAAIAVRDQEITLSDDEIAQIEKECPIENAVFKSMKDIRREYHNELHKAGAPLAPRGESYDILCILT